MTVSTPFLQAESFWKLSEGEPGGTSSNDLEAARQGTSEVLDASVFSST